LLRDHHGFWRAAFIATDLAVSAGVFLGSYVIRFGVDWAAVAASGPAFLETWTGWLGTSTPPILPYIQALPALALVLWMTNSWFRLYQPRRTTSLASEVEGVIQSNCMALLLLVAFFFFNRPLPWPRSVFLIFAVLNPLAMVLLRLAVRTILRSIRARGYNLRHVLIVGTGRMAQELIVRLEAHAWTGIRIVGLIGKDERATGRRIHGIPVVASANETLAATRRLGIDYVYIALPGGDRELLERLVDELSQNFIAVRIVPDIGYWLAPHQLTEFEGLPVVSVWDNVPQGWEAILKRTLDIGVAILGLIICLPLFATIGGLVKLTSRGPIFYTQERMGLDGRIFRILKFRTMQVGSDEQPGFTRRDDDRCTKFGRWLRRTSLDELPQLLNVLVGNMSVVGPRPERPVLIEQFRKRFPYYMLRHQVKAGITGWAQVNGWRGESSLRKRLQYDLYYLRHWSIWFDVKIIAMTFLRGLAHPNAY
jgi:Undecaprenyl-phosphate glucose phosphotransferase